MKIWLAYVNYPITTAVYIRRALLQAGHQVTTIGPRLPEEAIELWQLQNMLLPLDPLDIDTSFTPKMAEIWEATPANERPDLYLWVESVAGYQPQNLDAVSCPKACWLIDTHYHLQPALARARDYDYIFIAQLVDLQEFREIYPHTYWLPLACDPEIHGRQNMSKRFDIGFVGSMNRRREEMLDYLAQKFTVHRERSFWTDMARTFSESRIVLNDASFDDLNMRFFEALCSGSLLLSNPTNGSGQDLLFHNGEEYICHNDHNVIDIVRRYLENASLRERIAARGRCLVLTAHTYLHRVTDMLDLITSRKTDTFSPQELRLRSLQGRPEKVVPTMEHPPRIRSIISTRYHSNWPTWQMVHEWEDILSTILAVPLRPIGKTCMLPNPHCLQGNYDLLFLQLASELRYYSNNPQLIPVVMDLWRDDFDDFITYAPSFPLVFVCNLQSFKDLATRLNNLHYMPFTLADQYFDRPLPEKDIDIIHYGRRNPLLEQFMERLLVDHPELQYITTEALNDEKKVLIYSNQQGCLGESDSRTTFMALLDRSRISLVSTVSMDGSRNTGNIDPVSPRFLESMSAGCYLAGRIPDNDEFEDTGIKKVCYHVTDYESFKETILNLLAKPANNRPNYRRILQPRLTSSLALLILKTLGTLCDCQPPEPTYEVIMQGTVPRTDILHRLQNLKHMGPELSEWNSFMGYLTLVDAIAFYREFHNLDLSDLFSTIITHQSSRSAALLFSALELQVKGYHDAACCLAERTATLAPESPPATFLHAELLRRTDRREASRLTCLQSLKQWPSQGEFQAALDMCDIDEAMPTPQEHYHVLHYAHTLLRPRRYLEIGISNGKSLGLCQAGTDSIGVDPITAEISQLTFHSPAAAPILFKLTSNDFFQQNCLGHTWGSQPFDFAFIDGLHLFEQVLMDFVHLEQRSAPDSIIFIHDCLPVSIAGAERERQTMVWTGDVWKVIACLKATRTDLEIVTFPVRPSGLAMIRKLDQKSRLLANQFDTLVAHFMDAKLPESMSERFELLNVTEKPHEVVLEEIRRQQGAWQ
ncbi:glycosyltransferase [Trichlorobacter lovleyi]|uniref:glycosyltransferase family protein n=1 Tax=Trichlorobacter lovleyi TaxID=313985 RepID=UPI0022401612|nr:glycosyltransferase [Trichlorobacter lovleyi]QOX80332.1 glycosyltransferase [Trichlorobacter lovleyi]